MKMLNGVVVILRLFGGAARAWWDDDAPRLGASLAYYTLFAIAPILLVATAIAGSSRDQGNLNGAFGRSGGVLNNTYGDAAFCQHGRQHV